MSIKKDYASQLSPKHSFIIAFEQLYIIIRVITNTQTSKLETRKQANVI